MLVVSESYHRRLGIINHSVQYIGVEMKKGECICPLSWRIHYNFVCHGRYSEKGWVCTPHPHHTPAWANFSIMMACTPESGRCYSVGVRRPR
jgi:hypothetical protein